MDWVEVRFNTDPHVHIIYHHGPLVIKNSSRPLMMEWVQEKNAVTVLSE